jgi:hypothetical protein
LSAGAFSAVEKRSWNSLMRRQVKDDELVETARLSHADILPASCKAQLARPRWWEDKTKSGDINRPYKVDGRLVTVSRFGIRKHDLSDLRRILGAVNFPRRGGLSECQGYGW